MNSVELIRKICKERHIPISRLERDLSYANGYISQLRKGTLPSDRAIEISEYLGISLQYLLSGKEDDTGIESEISNSFRINEKDLMKLFGITKEQYLSQEEFIIDGEKVTRKDIEFIFDTMHSLLENVKKRSQDNDV